MALKREFLAGLGIESDKAQLIIDAHMETVNQIKSERDSLREKAGLYDDVAKERDTLKAENDRLNKGANDASKVQAEYDAYKKQVETDRANASKLTALNRALKDAGVINETFVGLLRDKVDLSKVEVDGEKIKDVESLINPLKESYKDCFASINTKGTQNINPLNGGNNSNLNDLSDEEYYSQVLKK